MVTVRTFVVSGVRILGAAALVACAARPAAAQGYAVRGGANVNPDQVYVGAHYELGPLAQHVWLQPSGDIGFGNDATLVTANVDFVYRRGLGRRPVWTMYGGGGPAINYYKLLGYNATEAGVNVIGGLMHSTGLFTEFRIGFLDSPQFRFGAGYAFRPGRAQPRTPGRAPRR